MCAKLWFPSCIKLLSLTPENNYGVCYIYLSTNFLNLDFRTHFSSSKTRQVSKAFYKYVIKSVKKAILINVENIVRLKRAVERTGLPITSS